MKIRTGFVSNSSSSSFVLSMFNVEKDYKQLFFAAPEIAEEFQVIKINKKDFEKYKPHTYSKNYFQWDAPWVGLYVHKEHDLIFYSEDERKVYLRAADGYEYPAYCVDNINWGDSVAFFYKTAVYDEDELHESAVKRLDSDEDNVDYGDIDYRDFPENIVQLVETIHRETSGIAEAGIFFNG